MTSAGHIGELMGRDHHERYRVCCNEKHESTLYQDDGVVIIPRRRRARDAVD
jgi:hypothetical protein